MPGKKPPSSPRKRKSADKQAPAAKRVTKNTASGTLDPTPAASAAQQAGPNGSADVMATAVGLLVQIQACIQQVAKVVNDAAASSTQASPHAAAANVSSPAANAPSPAANASSPAANASSPAASALSAAAGSPVHLTATPPVQPLMDMGDLDDVTGREGLRTLVDIEPTKPRPVVSMGAPIGHNVPPKTKEKIWTHKYVDLGELLQPNMHRSFTLSVQMDSEAPALRHADCRPLLSRRQSL